MRSRIEDHVSVRTVIVRYPDGDKQYWLTAEAFSVGDEICRADGRTLVVEQVLEPPRSDTHTTVKLMDAAA
jgi:hypothetical protein